MASARFRTRSPRSSARSNNRPHRNAIFSKIRTSGVRRNREASPRRSVTAFAFGWIPHCRLRRHLACSARPRENAVPSKLRTTDTVASAILTLRGQKVMLDASLAMLYDVTTKALNQAARRNRARFPADFMFRLTAAEDTNLRSQSVTSSSRRHGGRRNRPYAFTEQGVAMLSSVLKSPRAIAVNIEIMRAFVRLRATLTSHVELSRRIDGLEQKYDGQFRSVFQAIRLILEPPSRPQRRIGFRRHEEHTHSTRA